MRAGSQAKWSSERRDVRYPAQLCPFWWEGKGRRRGEHVASTDQALLETPRRHGDL